MLASELKISKSERINQFLIQILLLPISALEFVLSAGFWGLAIVGVLGYSIYSCDVGNQGSAVLMVVGAFFECGIPCVGCYFLSEPIYKLHLKIKGLEFSEGTSTSYGTHYVNKEVKRDIKDLTGHYIGEIVSTERVEEEDWDYEASEDEMRAPYFTPFALILRLITIFLAFIACFDDRIKICYVKPKELEKYDEKKYVFLIYCQRQKRKTK